MGALGVQGLWESVTPFPAWGFQMPLPGHVTSQLPADLTRSRTELRRHSQEHSYFKWPRSVKCDMCVPRVAPRTKGHSAKARRAKQVNKEVVRMAPERVQPVQRSQVPSDGGSMSPEWQHSAGCGQNSLRPSLGGWGLDHPASGLGLLCVVSFCFESNTKQTSGKV